MLKFAVAVSMLMIAGSSAASSASLCAPDEQTLFACPVGKKSVSLCISRGKESLGNHLRYVFGKPKAIELSFPRAPASGNQGFYSGSISYSDGSTIYVRFVNDAYEYIIYSNQGHAYSTPANPDSVRSWLREGVLVTRKEKLVANLPCRNSDSRISAWRDIAQSNALVIASDQELDRVEELLVNVE